MNNPGANLPLQPSQAQPILILKLYVTGGAINSLRALANLHDLCETYFKGQYQLEVIDIFDQPLQALADHVLMTPTLVKLSPPPSARIAGDLSRQDVVLLALQSGWSPPNEND